MRKFSADIHVSLGETAPRPYRLVDRETGVGLDLTGVTVAAKVYKSVGDATPVAATVAVVDALTGDITIAWPSTEIIQDGRAVITMTTGGVVSVITRPGGVLYRVHPC